jgi:hypothetical protein
VAVPLSVIVGDSYQWGRLADGYQIRTFATTTTLAVNTAPGLTATGIRGPYDWTLPNIVDNDGALRSAFLAKTVRQSICCVVFKG